MQHNPNKLIVISGCSGGGKSTLINELSKLGYSVINEAATEILYENNQINPCNDPHAFCQLLIERSIDNFHRAKAMRNALDNIIFFDRSHLEGIRYYKQLNAIDSTKYNLFLDDLRYFDVVYIAPPWEEIYCQNETRKHSFNKSVDDYNKVISFYPECGYQTIELPKITVKDRAQFILSSIRKM